MNGFDPWLAGLLGLLVGVAGTLAVRAGRRARRRVPARPDTDLDEGLARVLAVLRSAAVVLDDDDRVLRATAPAYAFGIVRDGRLAHEAIGALVDEVRRTGAIRDTELELPRGPVGPGAILVQLRVARLGPGRLLLLAEDRTEARRVEAIRRDFVVNVSHELKTPVGALALLAETVEAAADDPDAVRRFAGRMQRESTRLSALVHEVIELSRLQVAGALGALTLVDIDQVLAEAVDRARTAAAAKSITIDVGGERGATVYGGHALLVTAVRNLLDNAVAYSGPGTHVGVGVRRTGDLVELVVVDQGIGIAHQDQQRVFERFYRVDPARSRDTGGTGLGLSIVKHVLADHGGDVVVWSQPGRGSTFTLRIPAAHLPPVAPAAGHLPPAAPAADHLPPAARAQEADA